MGSGSDYTAFYHHLGIPSLNLGFGGEDDGGIYHSIYDSFHWYTTFSDTSFTYGRALAQTVGLATMRLASADVLPYEFSRPLRPGRGEREGSAGPADGGAGLDRGAESRARGEHLRGDERPAAAAGPAGARGRAAVPQLRAAAERRDPAQVGHLAVRGRLRRGVEGRRHRARLGERSASSTRSCSGPSARWRPTAGLPRRPWYRQLLSAPGWYTGYSAKTLPGVREAIEGKRWSEAEEQAAALGQALEAEAAVLDQAAELLERAGAGGREETAP